MLQSAVGSALTQQVNLENECRMLIAATVTGQHDNNNTRVDNERNVLDFRGFHTQNGFQAECLKPQSVNFNNTES